MNEGVIVLKSKYNKIVHIPISEIVLVKEHNMKTASIQAKLKDRKVRDTIVNSHTKQG